MTTRSTVAIVALILVGSLVAATPAAGVGQQQPQNESFGSTISSFMQASAADAEGSVDNGMWAAGFANADEQARTRLVTARIRTLERRLERLENRRTALLNDSAGNASVAEQARAARLAARAQALRTAINETETAGISAGVDVSRLQELRTNARNLTGREVAAIAVTLAGRGSGRVLSDSPPASQGNETAANRSNAGRERGGPPGGEQ